MMSITEGLIAGAMYWKDCACIERKRGRAILREAKRYRTELRAARREIEILKSSGETVNTVKDVTVETISLNIKTQQVIEDIEAGRNIVGPFGSEEQFFKELKGG
jgi:hypothetical protein